MARDSYRSLRDLNLERTFVVKNPEKWNTKTVYTMVSGNVLFFNSKNILKYLLMYKLYNPVETNSSIVRKEDPDTVVANIYIKVLPTSNYLII